MADIVQTISVTTPEKIKIPMPHFSDKVLGNHAIQYFDDKRIEIEYVAANDTEYSAVIDEMCDLSSQYLSAADNPIFQDIPVSLNLTFNVEQPVTWNVTYAFPRDIDDYINDVSDSYGTEVAPFNFTEDGVFNISLSITLGFARFGKNDEMLGLKFDAANISANISSFEPITEFDFSAYGLDVNPNTISITPSNSESQNTLPTYRCTISAQLNPR